MVFNSAIMMANPRIPYISPARKYVIPAQLNTDKKIVRKKKTTRRTMCTS